MVFSSSTVPELTQKHVRTLRQRCVSIIVCSACSPEIHAQVVGPFLQHLKEQTPSVTIASDPVTAAWAMFKQGALPCMIFKWLNGTAIEEDIRLPSADNWGFDLQNVRTFLEVCKDNFIATEEELLRPEDLQTDDLNVLAQFIRLIESILEKIEHSLRVSFDDLAGRLQGDELLFGSDVEVQSIAESEAVSVRSSMTKTQRSRLHALRELCDTEAQYVADLSALQSYVREVRLQRILSDSTLTGIFPNLDQIVGFQSKFQLELEEELSERRLSTYEASLEAHPEHVLLRHEQLFVTIYAPFIRNYKTAEMRLQEYEKLLTRPTLVHPHVISMSYLIKPIQRLCKYPILLAAIIKYTPADQQDGLKQAHAACQRIAAKVNEIQLQAENAAEDSRFRRMAGLVDDTSLGELWRFGPASLLEDNARQEYDVYGYEHHLLLVKKKKPLLKTLNGPIMTSLRSTFAHVMIKLSIPADTLISIESTARVEPNSIKVTYSEGHLVKFFLLLFSTRELHDRWLDVLRRMATQTPMRRSVGARSFSVPDIGDMLKTMQVGGHAPETAFEWPEKPGRIFVVTAFGRTLFVPTADAMPTLEQLRASIECMFLRTVTTLIYYRHSSDVLVEVDSENAMAIVYLLHEGSSVIQLTIQP